MSDFSRCPSCDTSVWGPMGEHRCHPRWQVQHAEHGDAWSEVFAMDEEHAVEKWAEWYEEANGDYSMLDGRVETVRVRATEDDPWQTFEVSGEAVPQYSATRVDGEASR